MRNFQKAVCHLEKASTSLSKACVESGMGVAGLQQQALDMQRFFAHPPEEDIHSLDFGDAIFEKTMALKQILEYVNFLLEGGAPVPNGWKTHKLSVSHAFEGRIPEDINPAQLQTEIDNLMAKGKWTQKDWQDPNTNEQTELWCKYEERYAQREIREVQFNLWKVWSSRRFELDQLHGSSVHGGPSFSFHTNNYSRNSEVWTYDLGGEGTCEES